LSGCFTDWIAGRVWPFTSLFVNPLSLRNGIGLTFPITYHHRLRVFLRTRDGSPVALEKDDVMCLLERRKCRFYVYFGFTHMVYPSRQMAPLPFSDIFLVNSSERTLYRAVVRHLNGLALHVQNGETNSTMQTNEEFAKENFGHVHRVNAKISGKDSTQLHKSHRDILPLQLKELLPDSTAVLMSTKGEGAVTGLHLHLQSLKVSDVESNLKLCTDC
jgi:hypothetical protein